MASKKSGGEQPLAEVKFLTVAEVATAMRVSKMTVYRLVHSGELPAVRVGRSFRVSEDACTTTSRPLIFRPDNHKKRGGGILRDRPLRDALTGQRVSRSRIALVISAGASSAMKCPRGQRAVVQVGGPGAPQRGGVVAERRAPVLLEHGDGHAQRLPAARSAWSCSTSMPAEAR